MQRRLVLFSLFLTLMLGMALVACGQAGPTPESGGDEPTAVAEPDPEPEADPEPEPDPEPDEVSDENLGEGDLVIYSGRSESLVGPIIERFEEESGLDVKVRYGDTSEMAATILEEGQNTPADVFYAQDPGGLGAVKDQMAQLPDDVLGAVDQRFRDDDGRWVGVTGRARVIVYNTDALSEEDLPDDIEAFTDPEWNGRLGWAPTNGSFQTMVTAMRVVWGEDRTREWLEGIIANDPSVYPNNTSIVAAAGAGEIDAGFVNHYYLYRFLAEEGESFPARNYFLPGGGPGSLVMVSGTGILEASDNQEAAAEFIRFLLSEEGQQYFASETYEYPMVEGVPPYEGLPPLSELNAVDVDLTNLSDLEGTLQLLRDVGALP